MMHTPDQVAVDIPGLTIDDLISEARALLVRYDSIDSDDLEQSYHERIDAANDALTVLERLLNALQPKGKE